MSIRREIILNTFQELIFKETGKNLDSIANLKADASDRKIYRLYYDGNSVIGVFNENKKENLAFINFTGTFTELGLNVPKIFSVSDDGLFYIEEDLGDMTLFNYTTSNLNEDHNALYKRSLSDLIKFQIMAKDKVDYSFCYQTMEFDPVVIESDLNKFDEYSNSLHLKTDFDQKVRKSIIDHSIQILRKSKNDFFLYRDFQPRNIMVRNSDLYYIDYQSGRKGPLQYDVASFLYSGSIDISNEERHELLDHYLKELGNHISINREEFLNDFYFFAFLRLLQMLGSYSYLSVKKNDGDILRKIPKALMNIKSLSGKINNSVINSYISKLTSSLN